MAGGICAYSIHGRRAVAPANAVQNRSLRFCRTPALCAQRYGCSQSRRSQSANKKSPRNRGLFCLLARPEGTLFSCALMVSYLVCNRVPQLVADARTPEPNGSGSVRIPPCANKKAAMLTCIAADVWRGRRDSNPRPPGSKPCVSSSRNFPLLPSTTRPPIIQRPCCPRTFPPLPESLLTPC
jgi:hypothetical protein